MDDDTLKIALRGLGIHREYDLYKVLQHSTQEERKLLCKNNKFKKLCDLLIFDRHIAITSNTGFIKYGPGSLLVILQSFDDFFAGLDFINIVRPGFIYTKEFKKYVGDNLHVENDGNTTTISYKNYKYEYMKYKNGFLEMENWYIDNKFISKKDGPAHISYYPNGNIKQETWYKDGIEYREDGPSTTIYDKNGLILQELWS